MNVTINMRQIDDVTVAALSGEIDGRTAPAVQEKLIPLAEPGRKILLDMSDVTYMSSAGLRTLLILYRRISNNNGCVALAGLSEMIRDTMSVTGFLDFFTAYDTLEEGMSALRADCTDQ